jgi:hypothetical protein
MEDPNSLTTTAPTPYSPVKEDAAKRGTGSPLNRKNTQLGYRKADSLGIHGGPYQKKSERKPK